MPGLGHRGYFGLASETAWGNNTPNALGREFMPILSESLISAPAYLFPAGSRASRTLQRKVQGAIKAGGNISWEVDVEDGIGILLKNILPQEDFTDYGAGNGALHVFRQGDSQLPPGICCKVFRDTVADPTNIWDYVGGRVKKLSFTAAENQMLKATCDLSFQKGTAGAANVQPAYTQQNPLMFHQGTFTSSAGVVNVKSFKLDIDSGLMEGRGQLGSQFAQQAQPGMYKFSGDVEAYFDNMLQVNAFLNATDVALTLNFLGTLLGNQTRQLQFQLPTVQFTGSPPVINGPGEIMIKLPFEGYQNDATTNDPLIITLLNSIQQSY